MIIYVDIDNTITMHNVDNYKNAIPDRNKIKIINKLYDYGHQIIYWTARGVGSGKDYRDLTEQQLSFWGAKYNELRLDKPVYNLLIDDKTINKISDDLYE